MSKYDVLGTVVIAVIAVDGTTVGRCHAVAAGALGIESIIEAVEFGGEQVERVEFKRGLRQPKSTHVAFRKAMAVTAGGIAVVVRHLRKAFLLAVFMI